MVHIYRSFTRFIFFLISWLIGTKKIIFIYPEVDFQAMYEGSRVTLKLNVYARPFYTLPLLYLPTYILRTYVRKNETRRWK